MAIRVIKGIVKADGIYHSKNSVIEGLDVNTEALLVKQGIAEYIVEKKPEAEAIDLINREITEEESEERSGGEVDLETLTKAELIELAEQRGIAVKKQMSKAEIIKLINGA